MLRRARARLLNDLVLKGPGSVIGLSYHGNRSERERVPAWKRRGGGEGNGVRTYEPRREGARGMRDLPDLARSLTRRLMVLCPRKLNALMGVLLHSSQTSSDS